MIEGRTCWTSKGDPWTISPYSSPATSNGCRPRPRRRSPRPATTRWSSRAGAPFTYFADDQDAPFRRRRTSRTGCRSTGRTTCCSCVPGKQAAARARTRPEDYWYEQAPLAEAVLGATRSTLEERGSADAAWDGARARPRRRPTSATSRGPRGGGIGRRAEPARRSSRASTGTAATRRLRGRAASRRRPSWARAATAPRARRSTPAPPSSRSTTPTSRPSAATDARAAVRDDRRARREGRDAALRAKRTHAERAGCC